MWRDMVAMERRTVSAAVVKPSEDTPSSWIIRNIKYLSLAGAIMVFIGLLSAEVRGVKVGLACLFHPLSISPHQSTDPMCYASQFAIHPV